MTSAKKFHYLDFFVVNQLLIPSIGRICAPYSDKWLCSLSESFFILYLARDRSHVFAYPVTGDGLSTVHLNVRPKSSPSMFPLLFHQSLSWGPIFHAVIADEFARESFPFLTDSQHSSFIRGSIYADDFDKSLTHNTAEIINHFQHIPNDQSDLYWFFMGLFAHVPPDTFAHAGKSRSFIVPAGIRHYASELVVDSLMMHRRPLPYFRLPVAISDSFARLNIRRSRAFRFAYPLFFMLSKLPLYRVLHWLEQDRCPKPDYETAICNFAQHYRAMLQSLHEAFPRMREDGFNDARVRELSTRLVFEVSCCDRDLAPVGIEVDVPAFESAYLLGSVL
jgi:hypothetical protein